MVQEAIAQQPSVPVSDPYVRLEPDLVVAGGKARVGFFTLAVEVSAAVSVDEGRAVPEIVEIRANGQPLGGFLRAQVEVMIDPYLQQWLNMETNIYVEEVDIREGQIGVMGWYK